VSGKKCNSDCQCDRHRGKGKRKGRKRSDNPGLIARHDRVRYDRGWADEYECQNCDRQALDWAQIHGTDGMDVMHYVPLCRYCHVLYDRGLNAYKDMRSRRRRR